MLISDKQHEANCKNAQHSSGPITPEGKAAVRLNALTHGLRARSTLISTEKQEEYEQFWDQLVAEWRPQGRTELLYLETACTSQWLLARVAKSERRIYEDLRIEFDEKYFRLLALVAKQRAQLERSFRTAIQDLKQSQKERQSQPQAQPVEAAPKTAESPAKQPAQSPVHPPTYVMAEPAEAHPVFCAPINPDTR
jgi:septum formation inhibitor MinC